MPEPEGTVVEVTEDNAAEIARKEFAAEKAEREGKEAPKEPEKKEEEPTAKTDEELLSAQDEGLSEEEKTRKETLVKAKEEKPPAPETTLKGTSKTDEQLLDIKDDDLNEEEKARKDTLLKDIIKKDEEKQAENERILGTEDKDLKPEEVTLKKELLAEKGKDIQAQEKAEQALEKLVKDYAKENKITEEQAKEELESIGKVEEKYGKDTKKLAKATLHIQRLFTKTNEELKILQQKVSAPALTTELIVSSIKEGKFTLGSGKKATEAEVIAVYRERYPGLTEKIEDDEVVLQMAAKEIKQHMDINDKDSLAQFSLKAREKRGILLENLSGEDKAFAADIKPVLEKMPDGEIMRADFDLGDLVRWAKGGLDIAKVKRDAFEDGFKKGRASVNTKIKTGPISAEGGPAGGKAGLPALTELQKNDALEMFPNSEPEEAYKLYAELQKDRAEAKLKKKGKE